MDILSVVAVRVLVIIVVSLFVLFFSMNFNISYLGTL